MPARLSVTVPLSGLAKVRRAKVSLPLVSALKDDPKYATELPAPTPRDVAKPPRNPSLRRTPKKSGSGSPSGTSATPSAVNWKVATTFSTPARCGSSCVQTEDMSAQG